MSGSSLGFEKVPGLLFFAGEEELLREQLYFFAVFLIIEIKFAWSFVREQVKQCEKSRAKIRRVMRERNNL